MKTGLITLLAAGIVFAGGWLAGRHHRSTRPLVVFSAEEMAGRKKNNAPRLVDAVAVAPAGEETSSSPALHWRPLPGERDGFEDIVRSATPSELKTIILSLGEPPEPAWAAQDLFRIWAERDPQGARWYFEQLPLLSRFALMQDFVAGWGERDASGVVAWLATQRSNAAVNNARASVLCRMAKDDPERACATLRSTGWLHESPEGLRSIMRTWIETDPSMAMQRWRELNLELSPPSSPDMLQAVPPYTAELVSRIINDAQAQGSEAVVRAIGYFTGEELREHGGFWWAFSNRRPAGDGLVVIHSPELVLPALEGKLTPDQMAALVDQAVREAPEKVEAIGRALSSPELRERARPMPKQEPGDVGIQEPTRVSLDEPIRLTP
jgi:hypothetical protein